MTIVGTDGMTYTLHQRIERSITDIIYVIDVVYIAPCGGSPFEIDATELPCRIYVTELAFSLIRPFVVLHQLSYSYSTASIETGTILTIKQIIEFSLIPAYAIKHRPDVDIRTF